MIAKHLRATTGLLIGIALLAAACGAPQQGITIRNVTNATAGAEQPTQVAPATGRATAAVTVAATTAPTQAVATTAPTVLAATQAPTQAAPTMAGMEMGTPVPATRAAATQAAGAATAAGTEEVFVAGWLLYGTPTGSPPAPGAATAAATSVATGAATAAKTGDFVVGELLFGTPTPKGSTPGSPATPGAAATTPTTVAATTVAPTAIPPTPTTAAAVPPTAVAAAATATNPAGAAAATSASGGAPSTGNPARGQQIFNGKGTCFSCHDVTSGTTIVGPSQKGIATRAGTRKPGMSAHDYLYESITKPNAFIVPGFQAGLMPQNFAQLLSPQEIEDVIAYMLTLK